MQRILASEDAVAAAAACGVSERTARHWLARFRREGEAGLNNRSSRPRCSPRQTSQAVVNRIIALRRERRTGRRIAAETSVSPATISRILRRKRLNHMRDLDPAAPIRRYEHAHPGDPVAPRYQRSSAASTARVIALPATNLDAREALVGSSFMSPATIIHASRLSASCPMNELPRQSNSSKQPSTITARWASRFGAC